MNPGYGAAAVVLVVLATIGIGAFGLRLSRTTSDFYVASRSVSPWWNASAIGGEYLSAASFLGVAGLVLVHGADMLWFPVGYTAGYLVLLVLVAAPLRRSGAYTLPDFAEARLESAAVRRAASVLVVLIGWLYLLPQFQGAGLTLRAVTGAPSWVGGAIVAAVVVLNVAAGGMRSITFVQAFQYWLKLTAIAAPVAFLLLSWRADGGPGDGLGSGADGIPRFRAPTTVSLPADLVVQVDEPVTPQAIGVVDGVPRDGEPVPLGPGRHALAAGTSLTFPPGGAVPHAEPVEASATGQWAAPLTGAGGRDHPLYATYSLILALFFGTMGLPHVLVRFYTNPDGREARRTTVAVLGLLGIFYLFPAVYGALGRVYAPDLLLTGRADAVVLVLPQRLVGGVLGDALGALVTAGAFAAFLSTSSGLLVSVTGVLSQDVLPRVARGARRPARRAAGPVAGTVAGTVAGMVAGTGTRRPGRGAAAGVLDFRVAALGAVAVPFALALAASSLPLADVVGLAFAVAASTFCPLLVLGIWWRRLTDVGALAGLLAGGGLAGAAVLATILTGSRTGGPDGWTGALLAQPAAWTMPIAFAVMVAVSLATPARVPAGVARTMVRLHVPESLRLSPRSAPELRPLGASPHSVPDRTAQHGDR